MSIWPFLFTFQQPQKFYIEATAADNGNTQPVLLNTQLVLLNTQQVLAGAIHPYWHKPDPGDEYTRGLDN